MGHGAIAPYLAEDHNVWSTATAPAASPPRGGPLAPKWVEIVI